MARNKAKDDEKFNCSQRHEIEYVASLYYEKEKVKNFLIKWYADNTIKNFTHMQVYELIKSKLGFPVPI